MPCKHICICVKCSLVPLLIQCPICRADITKIQRFFI
jgi:hypothetical protein